MVLILTSLFAGIVVALFVLFCIIAAVLGGMLLVMVIIYPIGALISRIFQNK